MEAIRQDNLLSSGVAELTLDKSLGGPRLKIKSSITEDHYVAPIIRWAFYFFVATIPFETIDLGIPVEITMISLGLLLLSLIFQIPLCVRKPPFAYVCFALFIATFAFMSAINRQSYQIEESNWQVMVLTQLLVLGWVALNILKSEHVAKRALITLALSCILVSVIQQLGMGGERVDVGGSLDRGTAFGFHPNNIARILTLGFLSIAGLSYAVPKSLFKSKLWVWIGMALIGMTIVQTGSRGGLLALVAGLTVFVLKEGAVTTKIRNGAIVLIGLIFLTTLVLQSELSSSRFEEAVEDGDLARREQIYPLAWQMFKERPFIGWGGKPGEYELGARIAHPEEASKNAHNMVLFALVATGLLGTVPLMFGFWLTVKTAWKVRDGARGVLPLSLLITVLVANMSGVWLQNKMHWFVMAYVLSSPYVLRRSIKIKLKGNQTMDATGLRLHV